MASLLISENYLKEYTNINKNVDMTILTPILQEVQDFYIIPLLGTNLYNEVLGQVTTSTVTALNQTLLDLVVPCMLHYAKMEAMPDMKYRLMNKGVMIKNSENSSAADLSEIQFLMDRSKNKAEIYAQRVTNYLNRYVSSYPLYISNVERDEIMPNRNNFTSGIMIDDHECDDCYKYLYK
jgi:hypothetical protein